MKRIAYTIFAVITASLAFANTISSENCPPYTIQVNLSATTICQGESVTATFTFPGGTPGTTYDVEWGSVELSDISSGHEMSLMPTATTTYVMEDVEDDDDCEPTNPNYSFTITVLPDATVSGPSQNPTVCVQGEIPAVSFTTNGVTGILTSNGLPPGVSASYTNNTVLLQGTPTQEGIFSYTIQLQGCGNPTASGAITVSNGTELMVQKDTVCQGDTFALLILNQQLFEKIWVKKIGDSHVDSVAPYMIHDIQLGEQIHIEALDINGCMTVTTYTQDVYPPILASISDTSYFCIHDPTMLEVQSGYDSYLWYDASNPSLSTSSSYTLMESQINSMIFLTVKDTFSCVVNDTTTVLASEECCSISAEVQNIACSDNGTPTNPDDDTYTFDVLVTGSNTGASWTTSSGVSGSYGTVSSFGPYPISGGDVTLTIQDIATESCTVQVTAAAPEACSTSCTISAELQNVVCSDNGTPTNPDDDTYTFDVLVTGANTGASWTTSSGASGSYGTAISFGPYPISGGDVTLTIQDIATESCTVQAIAKAPSTCSSTCSISTTVSDVDCDDNDTSDSLDDTFTFDLDVSGSGTITTWIASDSKNTTGMYEEDTSFGPFLIQDGTVRFVVMDASNTSCFDSVVVVPPVPCSELDDDCPELSSFVPSPVEVVNSACNDNCEVTQGEIKPIVCPTNAQAEYSIDEGTTWIKELPLYSQEAQTIIARCRCKEEDDEVSLASSAIRTSPSPCDIPVASLTIVPDLEAYCIGSEYVARVSVAQGKPPYSYDWLGSDENTAFYNFTPQMVGSQTIQVRVKDSNGCSTLVEKVINTTCCTKLSTFPASFCSDQSPIDLFAYNDVNRPGTWSTNSAKISITQGRYLNLESAEDGTYSVVYTMAELAVCPSVTLSFEVKQSKSAGKDTIVSICKNSEPITLFSLLTGASEGGAWSHTGTLDGSFDSKTGVLNTENLAPGRYEFQYSVVEEPCTASNALITLILQDAPYILTQTTLGDSIRLEVSLKPGEQIQSIQWLTSTGEVLCFGAYESCAVLMWNASEGVQLMVNITGSTGCYYTESIDIKGEECVVSCEDDVIHVDEKMDIVFDPTENDKFSGDNVHIRVLATSKLIDIDTSEQSRKLHFEVTELTGDTLWIRYEASLLNCTEKDTATVYILNDVLKNLVLPNFINPNGDGSNDVLRFNDQDELEDAELWIYNRYGDRVLYQKNYGNNWSCSIYPGGIYYYILHYKGVKIKRILIVAK